MSDIRERKRTERLRPHNILDDDDIKLLKWAMENKKPKSRVSYWLGISRRHLYRLIDQYGL